MSKVLIIGHSVLDRIVYKDNFQAKPGGIFHTANTFANLAEKDDEFYLLTQISNNAYQHFSEIYERINLKFSEFTDEIPTVTLNLYDNKERDEKYSRVTKKINLPNNIDFAKFDIILVNMISGFEITHHDLKILKEKSNCEIYFDVHTLSRDFDENGNRVFRNIPEVEKWLESIDILQMNENEMETLWGIKLESDNVGRLLECGVDKTIITKGEKGVSLFNKGIEKYFPSIKIDATNFVGCGDSFGAAFCFHFAKNKNLNSAVDFANLVAGIITSYNSQYEFNNLKNDINK